mgnify:CR=1 FL=1
MVLISVSSVEADNGYRFSNDFAEALIIEPNARISLENLYFKRKDAYVVGTTNKTFDIKLTEITSGDTAITLTEATYTGATLATEIAAKLNTAGNATGYYFKVWYNNNDSTFNFSTFTQEVLGSTPVNWVAYYFNDVPAFGQLIGFSQLLYITQGATHDTGVVLTSDAEPVPDSAANYGDIIHVNINNIPLHSIVGSKVSTTAVVDGDIVGSRNGITRMIAQVPRFHTSNGLSTSDQFGPFYYDYFPYSVPLKNAHSINLNDLQITVTNIDGTLAQDISQVNLLLNVSHEENIGGAGPETIGQPRVEHQAAVQSNQFQPQNLPKP